MTPKQKLLKMLPEKYRARVADLTVEQDLVDDCKYLLTWTGDYTDGGYDGVGSCYPVRSIKEAAEYVINRLYFWC